MTPDQFTQIISRLAVIESQNTTILQRIDDHEIRLRQVELEKAGREELDGFGLRLKRVEDSSVDHKQAVNTARKYGGFSLMALISLVIATAYERFIS